ncbi:hypothetical protein, variant [Phytophthora nicotianae CJ01A1]|uniref:Uncharacterized protein n=6 Tax=Phytophthora nicotianae TaxID=4792 RepID=W2QHV1_PHYN3|nr:hypothetical protein, variant [Phytophthora nicotianae INRA-310]ETI51626.1 hypothetical protein, variant [Phytophthora nicotianae P1569]ETK91511.1 hypothetical protein, variant [Phytophthora nicotianae]ETO80375.1 hypothetical protein, variant [Phytophthora nicotianae P1976]ETP21402.1 hypothetical protein, variant [Phytophthora nicotianae CJ01A1]ETP49323.1 hypothetical protein, variant [Phytophthora nicotianae P10297]
MCSLASCVDCAVRINSEDRRPPLDSDTPQIPIRATMAKSQQAARTSAKILRTSVNAMRTVSSHAASKASGLAAHPALRPVLMSVLMLSLLTLAVMSLGHFQLWMTGAGLFMVAMSIASAVQEFKLPKTAQSYQDFLDQEIDKCSPDMVTLPHLSPVKSSADKKQQKQVPKDEVSSMALNIASPAIVNLPAPMTPIQQEKPSRRESEDSIGALESAMNTTVVETSARRNSTEVGSKLDVLHCGTVIDIQGSQGFIIPHDLCVDATAASKTARSDAVARLHPSEQHKMPLVIPFNLSEEARQEIAVGKTVEFAYAADSPATKRALNVTPVPTDDGIMKSRSALQSCKQAREVSFARAMEELTVISPRNVPVKHHVDLIKYAEKLDDHDASFDL